MRRSRLGDCIVRLVSRHQIWYCLQGYCVKSRSQTRRAGGWLTSRNLAPLSLQRNFRGIVRLLVIGFVVVVVLVTSAFL